LETNYKIVNLINGLNIVGDVEYTPEEIIVKFPLEVTAKPIMNDDGNLVGEHMVLRPYLVMTDDREVFIDQFSVVSSCSLSERLYKSYEEMVSNVYDKTISLDGNFYKNDDAVDDELPEEIQEMSKEELDYLEEQLDLIASGKDKTFH
jgi:hypothetical protein